jgi:hypothetical protein
MDPQLRVVLEVVGGAAGLGLFWYYLYRAVLETRKRAGRVGIPLRGLPRVVGGALMATVLSVLPGTALGTALDPAREVATESQKLKRNQDGNGDPESDSQP